MSSSETDRIPKHTIITKPVKIYKNTQWTKYRQDGKVEEKIDGIKKQTE
uniref:Uncharacterized protein n=1 Tax=Leptospira mayottensis 200901116 TaxID=1192864 RepID=A0A343US00_9LEPT|nr:hypothetical protein [Leptospira mayottensis 200901116]